MGLEDIKRSSKGRAALPSLAAEGHLGGISAFGWKWKLPARHGLSHCGLRTDITALCVLCRAAQVPFAGRRSGKGAGL